jgi:hypothetical protein
MHRFCRTCIERAVREKHACPFCRKAIPSRRSAKEDLSFDMLIRVFYPDHVPAVDDEEPPSDKKTASHDTTTAPKKRGRLSKVRAPVGEPSGDASDSDEPKRAKITTAE